MATTTTLFSFNIQRDVKKQAETIARSMGLPLGTVMTGLVRDFVNTKRVVFTAPLVPNAKTGTQLKAALRDVANGKNIMSFKSAHDMDAYLDTL